MSASHGRPQPLLSRANVVAAISGLSSLLVTLDVFPATVGKSLTTTADAVVSVAFLLIATVPVYVHALTARKTVTPVANPRAIDGTRLVPEGSAAAEPSVVDALAAAAAIFPGVPNAEPVPPATPAPVVEKPRDPYASPGPVGS